ncbi:hypothetical protein JCM17844_20250 [Iodidimonas gelatinilytica]|uniref:RecA-like N-terminal domain-containing protein n=1 Tax=Iodidimonas gelatinilytica TaxID=1236966 RepID=A0A5A7MTR1_9PROT|nr:hypothetical protein JCM17844_20250 [Iodidimonas gelatinilytica]
MAGATLKVVGEQSVDKQKALDAALAQIDRAFGKGSVMKLGQRGPSMEADVVSTGSLGLDIAWGLVVCQKAESSKSMGRKAPVKPHWPFTPLRKFRKQVVWRHSWMPNMRLIHPMPKSWVWM